MGKIDVRILKLNKWYIPKTYVLDNVKGNVAIGHFDSVEIRERRIDTKEKHPFIGGYQEAIKWKVENKQKLVDHSSQEAMIFTNINEENRGDSSEFSEETIRNFWEDSSSPYLFLSMVHIEHMGKLKTALQLIGEVFRENYLSYISFDYCDIIIFAKKLYVGEFLNKVRNLFLLGKQGERNIFFDTFSMITFAPDFPDLLTNQKLPVGDFKTGSDGDRFQATVNVSVKDYSAFSMWRDTVSEKYPQTEFYNMYGRHDVSIVNNEADTEWLMYMMNELHKEREDAPFWTFETFIKVKDENVGDIGDSKDTEKILYETVKRKLEDKIDVLRQQIDKSELISKSSFLLPVYEVRDCICSIAKNSFAEEFVYCIYDSFQHFIQYMTECIAKMNAGKGSDIITETTIAGSYNKYFTALNTLVNSTMHSDRQFVQATSFNAIFYSVPPKIMAFYNAYVYRLKEILKDDDSVEQYSYLIYPSFSPIMAIEQVSLEDKPPCSRILTAKISEKSIYDMAPTSYQLVHELAHSIGDKVRCRDIRTKYMFHSLLQNIISASGIGDEKIIRFLEIYLEEIWLEKNQDKIYLQDFEQISGMFLQNLINNLTEETFDAFKEYCDKAEDEIPGDAFLEEFGLPKEARSDYRRLYFRQYFIYICDRVRKQLELMQIREKLRFYNKNVKLLKEIYSESYADLQMILILAVSPQDYLKMFGKPCQLSIEELFNSPEDAIRVSLIFKIMMDCGIWKEDFEQDASFKDIISAIVQYNGKNFSNADEKLKATWKEKKDKIRPKAELYIKERAGAVLNKRETKGNYKTGDVSKWVDLSDFDYITYGLYEYLLDVMEKALTEYIQPLKKAKIKKIHETVKTMLAAEDMIEVYNCIEDEIDAYRKELFAGI